MYSKTPTSEQQRIKLTPPMLRNFFENIFDGDVPKLSYEKGLSYTLVYNLVCGRIHSLSEKDYKTIFGEEPPYQEPKRVNGEFFRGMVRLWLFLNDDVTEADLYKEFCQGKRFRKVDYRIFNEDIKTIEARLEKIMEEKFLNQGLDRPEIERWIQEREQLNIEERVSYEEIKPILDYLEETLEVNPSRVLNQWLLRYESGELKTVPVKIYDYALKLKKTTEKALRSESELDIEKIREEIYGKRKGLTLFAEVKEELEFLQKHAGKSPKKYLGRSISTYKKSKLKRIASWRAQKIKDDCDELIRTRPGFALLSIPKKYLNMRVLELVFILKSYLKTRVRGDENGAYESVKLMPSLYSKEAYETEKYGYTGMEKAAHALGMSQKAFDLLVAENCELFRRIGRYTEKWYLPDLYLKELREKEGFHLIIAKYEWLAKGDQNRAGLAQCLTDRP